ncbi:MAG: enoyl-CoA hydratase/isomerase family protein [Myxococcales bacterium]|nr:enoyl-CoA hydratase/isomerase family protein [Myxococcales bacterium]
MKVAERLPLRRVDDAAVGRVEHVVKRDDRTGRDDHRRRLTDGPARREPVVRVFMPVLLDSHGPVGVLTLDRPARAHAYGRDHLDQLLAGAHELAALHPVLVITSSGERAFCGGADLQAMSGAGPLEALALHSQLTFTAIARLSVIVLAAVQGAAVAGGFELALACDLRVAGRRARFSLPETALGMVPSAGGTTRLTRLVGASRAKAVILGGEVLDAATALAWGLVNRISDDPRAEALAWATQIAGRDRTALLLAKELIDADHTGASLARERPAEAILYDRRVRP